MKTGRKFRLVVGTIVITLVGAVALILVMRQYSKPESRTIYAAYYTQTPSGPVVLLQEQRFRDAITTGDRRRDSAATQATYWFSHRVADGSYLGAHKLDANSAVAGVWNDRVWTCDAKQEPVLRSAETFAVVADTPAIRRAIASATGGDFETGARCFVDVYTGRLAVTGSNGSRLWLTTDLRTEPRPNDTTLPDGYFCNPGNVPGLIEPRLVLCLPPQAAPATMLTLSKTSALAKNANAPSVLSAVQASHGADSKALWSKPLTTLAADDAPFWLGAHSIEPHRVAIMMRTGTSQVHVVVLDPADGTEHERTVLFATKRPGQR